MAPTGALGQRVVLVISNNLMKKIITISIISILILVFPYKVFGAEKIIINNIAVDDFTKSPLMENEAGDLTLIETDKFKFYYYPSENYFFLGLFEPQSFRNALNEIISFLSLDFKGVCALPIKMSSFANEEIITLCSSPLVVDFDNSGKLTNNDLLIWTNLYKNDTVNGVKNFLDINFDDSVNALDYSLIYEFILREIPLDNN